MAICHACNREMLNHVSCDKNLFTRLGGDGKAHYVDPIPYPITEDQNCHDCGCPPGAYHHTGCDMERCPTCGGQAISCFCKMPSDELIAELEDETSSDLVVVVTAGLRRVDVGEEDWHHVMVVDPKVSEEDLQQRLLNELNEKAWLVSAIGRPLNERDLGDEDDAEIVWTSYSVRIQD